MNIEATVQKRLEPIIKNPAYSQFPKNFLYPKTLSKEALLFIGINPSAEENQQALASYELQQRDNSHSYFKKFENISDYCKTDWTHLDLLFFRETNQNTISDILRQEEGVNFIWEQLQIADQLIKSSCPKIIIVSNAFAGTLLGRDKQGGKNAWLNYDFKFDNEIGTHRWGNIPVFFSSMLTGQRALDNGSYERLKWQIKRTLIHLINEELNQIETDKSNVVKEGQYEWAAKLHDKEKYLLQRRKEITFDTIEKGSA